jgi:crotonobetainyl-CoA:carnitine CoA-transferase CaiB-like acyl-CoA transferase
MKKTTAEWLEKFGGVVPAAPILNLKEALENPFLKDRNNIQKLKTKNDVDISLLKTPVHISESTFEDKTAPELGEDTNAVLEEAGFTKKEIKDFKSEGII